MMPNRVFSTQNPKWGLFTIFKSHLKRSNKSYEIPKSTQNDAKTCFWYSEPEIRTLHSFKSHLKRSNKSLKMPKSTQNDSKTCFWY